VPRCGAVALLAVGSGIAFGLFAQASAEQPLKFDAASIKPNQDGGEMARFEGSVRFSPGRAYGRNISIRRMIQEAYGITKYQLSGGPGWLDSDRFDLEAKAGGAANEPELREMLQTLLTTRCSLSLHSEVKQLPAYALTVGEGGLKLPEWKEGDPMPSAMPRRDGRQVAVAMTIAGDMRQFARDLSKMPFVDRPVLDRTGLAGSYVMDLVLYDQQDIIAAVEEASGLRLEAQKAPLQVYSVDRVDRPSSN